MKFKFPFTKLRDHRKREEELAMRDFVLARQAFDDGVSLLESYYQSITETRKLASQLTQAGGLQAENLRQLDQFIKGQEIKIERQKVVLRDLNQVMEEKQAIAVEKAQQTKILDKLHDKQLVRFKEAVKRRELKNMDDMVTMGFRRSGEDQ